MNNISRLQSDLIPSGGVYPRLKSFIIARIICNVSYNYLIITLFTPFSLYTIMQHHFYYYMFFCRNVPNLVEKESHSIDDAFLKEVIDDIILDSQIGQK